MLNLFCVACTALKYHLITDVKRALMQVYTGNEMIQLSQSGTLRFPG